MTHRMTDINCKLMSMNSKLSFYLEKPKDSSYECSRLQEFHCSNEDVCDNYKNKNCPYSSEWKNLK